MAQSGEGAHRTPCGKRATEAEINIFQKQQSLRKQPLKGLLEL
jgi:hypothetical protein